MKKLCYLLFLLVWIACQPQKKTEEGSAPQEPVLQSVLSFDSTRIAYRVAGESPLAVVFVHGWCIDGSYFQPQLDHLAGHYQVVALDLAGHGASGAGRTDWSIEAFAKDVQAVVDALGLERVILVGHSMGDMIVTEAARLMPGKVVGLIGIDTFVEPGFQSDSTEFFRFYEQINSDFPGITRAWIGTLFHPNTDSTLVAEILDDMAEGPPAVCLGGLMAIHRYLEGGGYERAVKALKIPVRTLNAVVADTAAWKVLGVNFQVIPLRNVGHYPMREDPEGLNKALDAVLKEWEE